LSSCSRLSKQNINQKKGRCEKKKNLSNNIHGKANKPFKREINLKEKPKFNTSRTRRKVDMKGKH